jgi:hypothetical protein
MMGASCPVVASDPNLQKSFFPAVSRTDEFHVVDMELRVCDWAGWHYKYYCSHLGAADRTAWLRRELTGFTFPIVKHVTNHNLVADCLAYAEAASE